MADASEAIDNRHVYRRLLIFVLLGIVGLELHTEIRMLASQVQRRTSLEDYVTKGLWTPWALIRPLHARGSDSVDPLRAARQFARRDPNLYATFTGKGSSFVYPPTAAVVLFPFGWIGEKGGDALESKCFDLFLRMTALCMAIAVLRSLGGILNTWGDWIWGLVLIVAFFPIRWGVCCMNVQVFINALLVAAILAHAWSRGIICGFCLGLACALKPHLGVLVLFAFVRKEWKTGLTAITTSAVLAVFSVAMLGAAPWRTYISDILPLMSAGYATHGNQTFLGAVRRWIGDPDGVNLYPISHGCHVLTLVGSALLIVLALLPRKLSRTEARPMEAASVDVGTRRALLPRDVVSRGSDMSIALFASLIASPIAWDSHYGWAILAFALALIAAKHLRWGVSPYVVIGVCYVFMAADWVPFAAIRPGIISLLDGGEMFSAVVLCIVLWYACGRLTALPTRQCAKLPISADVLDSHPAAV